MNALEALFIASLVYVEVDIAVGGEFILRDAQQLLEEDSWVGKRAPELAQGTWINSKPLQLSDLRGKVVLLEFWTYGCYNCRNTIPAMNRWHQEFKGEGLVMIGVHTPEFDREKNLTNVRDQTAKLGIKYAVVTDNDYQTWTSYDQRYWPVVYLIDKEGIIRYVHIGEGRYDETRRMIQSLIAE